MAIYNLNNSKKRATGAKTAQELAAQVARKDPKFTTSPKPVDGALPALDPNIKAMKFDPGSKDLNQASQDSIASKGDVSGRFAPPKPVDPTKVNPVVSGPGVPGNPAGGSAGGATGAVAVTGAFAPGSNAGSNVRLPGQGAAPPKTNAQLQADAIRKLLEGVPDGAAERKALQDQQAAQAAQAIQSTRARTGLGGMGLTGAAGALESQVRTETGDAQTRNLADFDRNQRKESAERALAGIEAQRGADVFDAEAALYENEADIDVNKDGLINGQPVSGVFGDGDPSNNPAVNKETPQQKAAREDTERKAAKKTFEDQELRATPWLGDPKDAKGVRVGGVNYDIYTASNGNKYKVRSSYQNAADTGYTNLG